VFFDAGAMPGGFVSIAGEVSLPLGTSPASVGQSQAYLHAQFRQRELFERHHVLKSLNGFAGERGLHEFQPDGQRGDCSGFRACQRPALSS